MARKDQPLGETVAVVFKRPDSGSWSVAWMGDGSQPARNESEEWFSHVGAKRFVEAARQVVWEKTDDEWVARDATPGR